MTNSIAIGFIATIFGGLFGYFVSSITNNKAIEKAVTTHIINHEQIYHQEKVRIFVKNAIDEHIKICPAHKDFYTIKKALAVLVQKAGENPVDLGLL